MTTQNQTSTNNPVGLADRLAWSKEEASMMCGVSTSTFNNWMRLGLMPRPTHGNRFSAYVVRQAFKSIDAKGENASPSDAYDNWRKTNGQR